MKIVVMGDLREFSCDDTGNNIYERDTITGEWSKFDFGLNFCFQSPYQFARFLIAEFYGLQRKTDYVIIDKSGW